MSSEEPNHVILIASDIHLGAFESNTAAFNAFLSKILDGGFGDHLKFLIILGDFLDMMFDTPAAIEEKHQDIHLKLKRINQQKNVELIYILGNHEIPVNCNPFTGDLFDSFEKSKKEFIPKLSSIGILNDLFNSDNVCQDLILKKDSEGNSILVLYDSFEQSLREIEANGINLDDSYECLITHGYRFDGPKIKYFASIFWRTLIEASDQRAKDLADYFWNELIRSKVGLANADYNVIKQRIPNLTESEYNTMRISMKLIEKFESKRDRFYYSDRIAEYLEDEDNGLLSITSVIYGHSHEKQDEMRKIHDRWVKIINSGAWQHVTHPSYVTIDDTGEIHVFEFYEDIE